MPREAPPPFLDRSQTTPDRGRIAALPSPLQKSPTSNVRQPRCARRRHSTNEAICGRAQACLDQTEARSTRRARRSVETQPTQYGTHLLKMADQANGRTPLLRGRAQPEPVVCSPGIVGQKASPRPNPWGGDEKRVKPQLGTVRWFLSRSEFGLRVGAVPLFAIPQSCF